MLIRNLEVSDVCGLGCSSCAQRYMTGENGKTLMKMETFETLISTGRFRDKVWLNWRGESCLNQSLPEMVEYASLHGLETKLSTNGVAWTLLDKVWVKKLLSDLDYLMFCVDGYNQESLEKYRVGAKWSTLMKALENISQTETNCSREMRVLMFKHNDKHQEFYRELAQRHGFDAVRWGRPIINYKMKLNDEEVEEWFSSNEKYQRYHLKDGEWHYNRAEKCQPHFACSVKGTIHACGNDYNLDYPLGNLLTDDWNTIISNFNNLKPKMTAKTLPFCESLCCLTAGRVDYVEKL